MDNSVILHLLAQAQGAQPKSQIKKENLLEILIAEIVKNDNITILEKAVAQGYDINETLKEIRCMAQEPKPDKKTNLLEQAIKTKAWGIVDYCLKHNVCLEFVNKEKPNPFLLAMYKKNYSLAYRFLDLGLSTNSLDDWKNTAAHILVGTPHFIEHFPILLSRGYDPQNLWNKNTFGQSVLGKGMDRDHPKEAFYQIISCVKTPSDIKNCENILKASTQRNEKRIEPNLNLCWEYFKIRKDKLALEQKVDTISTILENKKPVIKL